MADGPDSVMRHQKFEDLMKRYHGQMESALYAAEQACKPGYHCTHPEKPECPWRKKFYAGLRCDVFVIREILGDHVSQHYIDIPADTTQAELKGLRQTLKDTGFVHTDTIIVSNPPDHKGGSI